MKKNFVFIFLTLFFCGEFFAQPFVASNFTLISRINPETGVNQYGDHYSGCWGWYQQSKNKEYAIACAQAGTYWVDVTNPATPTVCAYRPAVHASAVWREAATYQNYCYVISDDAGSNSFQIFDMSYLPDSVRKIYDGTSYFSRAHTLFVDGNKLYLGSVTYSNNSFSSMNVYSLANPANPTLLRSLDQDYPFITKVHDMFVRNDTVFASCEYQGLFVFKLTAANTFTQLGSLTSYTAAGYNHSSALTPNGKTLVFTDEVPSALPIKVANVSNLGNIQVLSTVNQFTGTTPHNPFIVNNNYCFVSSYEDGLQLFNISNPSFPFLAGYFDTYPPSGGNTGTWLNDYDGLWSCYPFFPSKTIYALDQLNGLFLLKTNLYANPPSGVGIGDESGSENSSVRFFPNPVKNILNFNLPASEIGKQQNVKIYSSAGTLVYEQDLDSDPGKIYKSIDLSALPSGIYFLRLSGSGLEIASKKLVISGDL